MHNSYILYEESAHSSKISKIFLATVVENLIFGVKTMCCYGVQKSQDEFIISLYTIIMDHRANVIILNCLFLLVKVENISGVMWVLTSI